MSTTAIHSPPIADAATPAVTLLRVSKLFGSFVALREVTLELAAGSSAILLGPNGSGKSTLLRLLAGLHSPTYGEVRVFGRLPAALRGRIAYMSHSTMLYDELTGPENLDYLLALQQPKASARERSQAAAKAIVAVGLDPSNPRRLGEYSQGMRQRTALARVLLAEPDLLLLDEPFSNLDVESTQAMIARLQAYRTQPGRAGQARTLLLTTHQADLARPLAQRWLRLDGGRLTPADPENTENPAPLGVTRPSRAPLPGAPTA